jgi:hypothetical protein
MWCRFGHSISHQLCRVERASDGCFASNKSRRGSSCGIPLVFFVCRTCRCEIRWPRNVLIKFFFFFFFLLLFILSLLSLFGLLVSLLFYASYSSIQDRSPNDLDIFWGLFVCFQSKLQKVKLGQSPIEIIRKPKGRKKERKEERKKQ